MRIVLALVALGSLVQARECSLFASDDGEAEAEAEVTAAIDLPPPAHGGTVLQVEEVPLEVVASENGVVHAYALDVEGGVALPPEAEVTVEVNVEDGDPRPVELRWVADAGRFEGRAPDVHVVPGPVVVHVDLDGEVWHSPPRRIVVVPPRVVADVDVRAERSRARRPRHRTDVRAEARVRGPDVRVEVDVPRPPPPPSVRLEVNAEARVGARHRRHGKHRKHRKHRGHRIRF